MLLVALLRLSKFGIDIVLGLATDTRVVIGVIVTDVFLVFTRRVRTLIVLHTGSAPTALSRLHIFAGLRILRSFYVLSGFYVLGGFHVLGGFRVLRGSQILSGFEILRAGHVLRRSRVIVGLGSIGAYGERSRFLGRGHEVLSALRVLVSTIGYVRTMRCFQKFVVLTFVVVVTLVL